MKQAVILAGGKGTRLRSRLGDLPKPLVDICGMPLLEHQIRLLERFGYTDILLLVNHGALHITNYCSRRGSTSINIECIDDGEPRGTAGATLAVFDRLSHEFLVVYGDTMLEVDLLRFYAFHKSRPEADATLYLHPNDHPGDSDLVEIGDEGRVITFHPYPHDASHYYPNMVNAALYYLRRDAIREWRGMSEVLDFGRDIFPAMLTQGKVLLGYNGPEYIKDCGTPARLDRVCEDLASGRVARSNLNVKQRAVFLDRDGVINKEVGHLFKQEQFELLPEVVDAIKRLNVSEYRTVVVTNQPVLARGDCSPHMLRQIHNKMETELGKKGAYLDRIYICPHHPDRGYSSEVAELKVDCSCRKPGIGMIERAVKELNVEIEVSWLIGDTTVDILTAQRSGLRSILVETGFAGLDRRHWVTPDFTAPDLMAAVDFILVRYPRLLSHCTQQGIGVTAGDFVFIGGLSRSGKSNLASTLHQALRSQQKRAVILRIDNWLKSEAERSAGVLGRYQLDELNSVISFLAGRKSTIEISIPAYDKLSRKRIDSAERIFVGPDDIVIVEGTIALSLVNSASGRKSHTWFVEVDEMERHERVLREYLLRGFSLQEAESIYHLRQSDEVPFIFSGAEKSSFRINPQSASTVDCGVKTSQDCRT